MAFSVGAVILLRSMSSLMLVLVDSIASLILGSIREVGVILSIAILMLVRSDSRYAMAALLEVSMVGMIRSTAFLMSLMSLYAGVCWLESLLFLRQWYNF
jgi:hypothetical protein